MTQSLKRQLEAARNYRSKTIAAAFAGSTDPRLTLSSALARTPIGVVRDYEAIVERIAALEHEAVAKGRAWRGTSGLLFFYRIPV